MGALCPFYTVGHSTRSVAELAGLLREAGADLVVDVRTMPRSRTNPQFNFDALPSTLASYQIGYRHIGALGGLRGRRKGQAPSRNTFWENASFRNYADYAAASEFREGLAELRDLGHDHTYAIMCAVHAGLTGTTLAPPALPSGLEQKRVEPVVGSGDLHH